jgi:hypothetical protein
MGGSVTWKTVSRACLGLAVLAMGQQASSHGGVYVEEDICVIQIGYLKAHFKVFQPRTRRYEEYCEDLPDVTESVFVLEYAHDELSNTALEFRIIRDVTGLGRFARWEDIVKIDDIDAATVFHKPASLEPDLFMSLFEFDEPGNYVGIVTVTEPTSGELIHAVFPFEVGFAVGLGYWPLLVLVLILIQANYWWLRRRVPLPSVAPLMVISLLVLTGLPQSAVSEGTNLPPAQDIGSLRVTLKSQVVPIPTNQMHSWVVRVTNLEGEPMADALIEVEGGMPKHDHGLPTSPRMTRYLGDGDYLIEGMKFHMRGSWELLLKITLAGDTQVVSFQIAL